MKDKTFADLIKRRFDQSPDCDHVLATMVLNGKKYSQFYKFTIPIDAEDVRRVFEVMGNQAVNTIRKAQK